MIPGERLQANLRMRPENFSGMQGAELVQIISVDHKTSRVEVSNSNGTRWARVLFRKTSKQMAGNNDMPNVDDWGVVIPVNTDAKSLAWIGSVNTVEPSENLVNDSNYPGTDDGLIHRDYKKHETGSFSILDKLGNLLMTWFKKKTSETDAALQNLTISLQAGVLTLTHFRGTPSTKGLVIVSDQDGNLNIQNFKTGGAALAFSATVDNGGGMTFLHATSGAVISFTEAGKIVIDGPGISLGSGALAALVKAAIIPAFNLHVHTSTAPGNPTSVPAVPLVATDPTLVTQKVEGA